MTAARAARTEIFGSRLPRLVGVVYLALAMCGLTGQLSARLGTALLVDASASAETIRASAWIRIGLAADALYMVGFVGLSLGSCPFRNFQPAHRCGSARVRRGRRRDDGRHDFEAGSWRKGPGGEWNSFAFFSDPDGNGWVLQESAAPS